MRERIRQHGLGSLMPHEVLEYLLYPFVPRRNTNDLAHRLLDTFGNLAAVLDAPYDALKAVNGMTANAALFLSQIAGIQSLYNQEKEARLAFQNPQDAVRYLRNRIGNLPVEVFAALCLDAKGNLLSVVQFESQSADYVAVNVRKLVREVLLTRAVNVIVAHNHPSGDVSPSGEDVAMFQHLQQVLASVDVTLLDCLIVSDRNAYSMMVNDGFQKKIRLSAVAEGPAQSRTRTSPLDALYEEEQEYDLLFNRNQ